ncbi:hypothetical protein QQ045_030749 [Rhodiola kirilowii]
MAEISLIFIPFPLISHLTPTIEIAKILLSRDHRLSITFLIIDIPQRDSSLASLTTSIISDRLHFLDVVVTNQHAQSFTSGIAAIESAKPAVKQTISDLVVRSHESAASGPRIAGFVLDMFCTAMIEIATEFNLPSYIYYTCGSSFLSILLHVQKLCDDEALDVANFKNSSVEFSLPEFSNLIPARLLPSMMFDKDFSDSFVGKARAFRKTKGILVNSFVELEPHAIKSIKLDRSVPPIYPVGPVLNMNSNTAFIRKEQEKEIMEWLDQHPPASVVFLCFGSRGAFKHDQVKEIARGLESSGCRFLWALRQPSSSNVRFSPPTDYENFSEVLPEGFLQRTYGVGKVIGWAPQTAVLDHPSVGGFVSHCGWNSILESLWFGVLIATWPLCAEQQMNAFEVVKEMGIGVEISLDYRLEMGGKEAEGSGIISGEQIERGIRDVMQEDSEVRKKVKLMMEKSREAVVEGGSSYNFIQNFISDLRTNIGL